MSSKKSSASSSAATASSTGEKHETRPKVDPSFKSKRYRDKLRTEVKALEGLLPVDRTSLSRKLDSQTVFRLVIAFLRTKGYCQAVGLQDESELTINADSSDYKRPRSRHGPSGLGQRQAPDQPDPKELIQGLSCLQVLDGFLLVLTADGTILYVSDNVLQYLGYNQVDLMHRCLYSIIHHDDMLDLKMILETSLGPVVTHYEHPDATQDGTGQHLESCSLGDDCKPVSFICRMRCFSGSSVGYLKMHCSGKIVRMPGLVKSKRFSGNVVLLFCNPFMLRAAEFTTELQKNVFWSKHDLDLNVKEIDKKGADILGFDPEELEKRSFYTLIHPEDLTTVVSCHKMLVESTEVQTVYFRLQTKAGDWVWLTSRGKVISKNSKKFSIAFSHCPLREEDSTYIQQEAVLRRRYAISDLMCLSQFKQSSPQPLDHQLPRDDPLTTAQKNKRADSNKYHPYYATNTNSCKANSTALTKGDNKKDSSSGILDSSCIMEVACPSAWHAMSDRHSPVLPSSHVAHKISQREKQLQFQEFCRRQQMEAGGQDGEVKPMDGWDIGHQYPLVNGTGHLAASDNAACGLPITPSAVAMSYPSVGGFQISGQYPNGQFPPATGVYQAFGYLPTQNSAGPYMPWQTNGSSACFVDTHSPVSCLTPSRSPHQNRAPNPTATQVQPGAYPPQVPPYDPGYSHTVPCASMPPSPPPSPLTFNGRPAPSYQCSQEPNAAARMSDWHFRYPYVPYQAQQPPPYPKKNTPAPSETVTGSSTITDLQKTTEKFLQVKEEDSSRDTTQNTSASQAGQPQSWEHNRPEVWSRPAWAFGSYTPADRTAGSATPVFGHLESSGLHFPSSYSVSADFSFTNSPLGPAGRQYYHPGGDQMPGLSMSQTFAYTHPQSVSAQGLGSPPAYPYAVYQQTVPQGPQIHMNGFYGAQVVPVKTVDFSRPVSEHVNPLDLPSIGSFLEYLNEV